MVKSSISENEITIKSINDEIKQIETEEKQQVLEDLSQKFIEEHHVGGNLELQTLEKN